MTMTSQLLQPVCSKASDSDLVLLSLYPEG